MIPANGSRVRFLVGVLACLACLSAPVAGWAQAGVGVQVPLTASGSLRVADTFEFEAGVPLDLNLSAPGLMAGVKWYLTALDWASHPFRWYVGATVRASLPTLPALDARLLSGLALAVAETPVSLFAQVELLPGFDNGLPLALSLGGRWTFR